MVSVKQISASFLPLLALFQHSVAGVKVGSTMDDCCTCHTELEERCGNTEMCCGTEFKCISWSFLESACYNEKSGEFVFPDSSRGNVETPLLVLADGTNRVVGSMNKEASSELRRRTNDQKPKLPNEEIKKPCPSDTVVLTEPGKPTDEEKYEHPVKTFPGEHETPGKTHIKDNGYTKNTSPAHTGPVKTHPIETQTGQPEHPNETYSREYLLPLESGLAEPTQVQSPMETYPNEKSNSEIGNAIETDLAQYPPLTTSKIDNAIETDLPEIDNAIETDLPEIDNAIETGLPEIDNAIETNLPEIGDAFETDLAEYSPLTTSKIGNAVETDLPKIDNAIETDLPEIGYASETDIPKPVLTTSNGDGLPSTTTPSASRSSYVKSSATKFTYESNGSPSTNSIEASFTTSYLLNPTPIKRENTTTTYASANPTPDFPGGAVRALGIAKGLLAAVAIWIACIV